MCISVGQSKMENNFQMVHFMLSAFTVWTSCIFFNILKGVINGVLPSNIKFMFSSNCFICKYFWNKETKPQGLHIKLIALFYSNLFRGAIVLSFSVIPFKISEYYFVWKFRSFLIINMMPLEYNNYIMMVIPITFERNVSIFRTIMSNKP